MTRRIVFTTLILLSAALFVNAQTIEKKSLTIEGANKVIAGAVAYAKKNNAPGGAIAVVDEGGNLMALERLDGTFAAGANISIGKARTAVLFKRPTKAIRQVVRGGFYVTPLLTDGMVGSFVQNFKRRKSTLSVTPRQKEVLQLLAEGRSMKEAAFVLNVSPRTVAFHKYAMMDRLHIRSSAGAGRVCDAELYRGRLAFAGPFQSLE